MRRAEAVAVWREHHETKSRAEMADLLGVSTSALKNALDRAVAAGELAPRQPSTPSRAKVLAAYAEGKEAGQTNQQIADGLGLTRTALKKRLERALVAGEITRTQRLRPQRSAEEVLEEFVMIKDSVGSVSQAATRMGMGPRALEKALSRARKAGDDRGVYAPLALRVRPPGEVRRVAPETRDEILEEWPTLREDGYDFKSAAARLGRNKKTVSLAINWAIETGHPAGLRPLGEPRDRHPRRAA